MSLSKKQILERLRSTKRESFLNSPYFRASEMTPKRLAGLLKNLKSGGDDLAGSLRPLLLMSVSSEIQSMSGNFSGDGSTISDKEASDRAEVFANELLSNDGANQELKQIENKSRYPYVDWLDEPRIIGSFAKTPLVLLGYEQGTDDLIVSRDGDTYSATPLSELLSHAQDPIEITENYSR